MKRDMDLARQILLALEGRTYYGPPGFPPPKIQNYTLAEVKYHVTLLSEAGLIKAEATLLADDTVNWQIERLTSSGHDFLENAKNQKRWDKAKEIVLEKGSSLTFDILKTVLTQLARQAVEL